MIFKEYRLGTNCITFFCFAKNRSSSFKAGKRIFYMLSLFYNIFDTFEPRFVSYFIMILMNSNASTTMISGFTILLAFVSTMPAPI